MMQKLCWTRDKIIVALALLTLVGCTETKNEPLKILGPFKVEDRVGENGVFITDTIYTAIRPFEFIDQDGNMVSEKTVENKLYVTDFFFTSCPTICPKMKQQMLRVYDEFASEPDLIFLSHSIDPKRDSVGRLHDFAEKLGIDSKRWHLMTGERDSIYSMARHYLIAAQEDEAAPGGFAHSGAFLLVDKNRQIRGIYDGVDPDDVDKLMLDIRTLLDENKRAIQ